MQEKPRETRPEHLVIHQPMQICMNCTTTFHQTNSTETSGSNLEATVWSEVCALAQRVDKPGILRAVPSERRNMTTADIFGRGDLAEKVGQDITWYEDGDEREGTVALIATDREGGTLKAYVVSSDMPTHAQTGEPWTELSIDELQRARETKKCHNERLYLRRREEGWSTPPRRHDYPVRPSPDVEDKISAIKRAFAEAGYVMEEPTEGPNALLHCLADNIA